MIYSLLCSSTSQGRFGDYRFALFHLSVRQSICPDMGCRFSIYTLFMDIHINHFWISINHFFDIDKSFLDFHKSVEYWISVNRFMDPKMNYGYPLIQTDFWISIIHFWISLNKMNIGYP